VAGVYTLRISASDSVFTSYAEVSVQAGQPFSQPDPALALWLELDESAGTTGMDSSGSNYNATLSGGTAWLPSGGMRSGALDFDGLSGQAIVSDADALDNTSAFTLAYWFRADSYPADSAGLVCKRDAISSQNAYTTYLKAADKHIYVDIDGADNRFASAALINTGVWYHVALVYDGSLAAAQRVNLWINGVLDVTATETSASIPNYTSSVRLGNTHPGAVNWFDGRIDDVRWYRRALAPGEIATLAYTNLPPNVATGPAPAATNGITASLTGSVTDDGAGGPLTLNWSQVSGPGTASFFNSNNAVTTVTFNRSGSYTLRLCATDTRIEVCSELNINVAPNTKTFEDWIALSFPGETNNNVVGIMGDPDSDEVKNLMEFALGMQPSLPDATHFGQGQPGLPLSAIVTNSGTNYLALRVRRPIGLLGILYAAELSSDFTNWTAGIQAGSPIANGDGSELVTFRDVQPLAQFGLRLMRLRVTKL
jgi:hypothetical protein